MNDAVTITPPQADQGAPLPDYRQWMQAILLVARHYRMDVSEETVRLAGDRPDRDVEDVCGRWPARPD